MSFKDGSRIVGGRDYRQSKGFRDTMRKRDSHTCQLCGSYGYEVDHIIPFAICGETVPNNLRVLCVACNRATRLPRKDANPFISLDGWYSYIQGLQCIPTGT